MFPIHPSIYPLTHPSIDPSKLWQDRSELEQLTVLWPCSTWWRILTKWRTRCWQCVCSRAPSPRTAIYFEREGGKRWSWRTRGKRKSQNQTNQSTVRNANLMLFLGFRCTPPAHLHRNKLFLKAGWLNNTKHAFQDSASTRKWSKSSPNASILLKAHLRDNCEGKGN